MNKCIACKFETPPSSKFCAQCGTRQTSERACEACGQGLLPDARFCPACGISLDPVPSTLATEDFESQLYHRARHAFFHRFVERVEKKETESTLYGVVRLLSRRSIELDMVASLSDLACVLAETAEPHATTLRPKPIMLALSDFLATVSTDARQKLERLDAASGHIAVDLIDHSTKVPIYDSADTSTPWMHSTWPGIGVCIGPAVVVSQLGGELTNEAKAKLHEMNRAFHDFVAAYDLLWLPLFLFIERYMADKCNLHWRRISSFELDFVKYSALIVAASNAADEQRFDEALEATRLARNLGPEEPLALLLEGQLLKHLDRRNRAMAVPR